MSILEVKNIRKSFGNAEVLRGIDFTLRSGEVLAIIGSSGSGKTTLLRSLNFLETPDCGTVSLDGELLFDAGESGKLSDADIRRRRLHFGLVFQSFNLFPQYTVLKNVMLAPELLSDAEIRAKRGISGGDRRAMRAAERIRIEEIARELIRTVGLEEKTESYPCMLSGGQQQRVAIARALALHPDVLCFDEPTSALDPELTGEVLRVIRSLKDRGCTMIVVTHEMEFARGVADHVIYMADGVIEEEGTPDEVFGSPKSEKTRAFIAHAFNHTGV